MREAGGTEHGGVELVLLQGMPVPPGVVMVSPPKTLCNTERAQRESRAREGSTKRGQRQYKGRNPDKDPGRSHR